MNHAVAERKIARYRELTSGSHGRAESIKRAL